MNSYINKPYRSFAILVGLLLIAFLLMEGWLYSVKPSAVHNKDVYQASLDKATQSFRDTETELLDGSRQLAERLEGRLQAGVSRQSLFEALQSSDSFWGVTLFRDSAPQIWSGFSFPEYPDRIPADGEPYVDVRKQNNVILMLCRIAFTVESESGPVRYNLVTTRRIEQKNALPIGRDKEYSLLTDTNPTLKYPVELSFFEPFPTSQLEYRVLYTASSDSVGIAYAPPGKFNISAADWQQDAWFWRSMFSTFAFALLFIFFYLWFERRVGWQALFFQVGILFVGWLFFSLLAIPDQWLLHFPGSNQQTNRLFSSLVRKSVFVFLIALTLSRHLRKMQDKTNRTELFRTLIFSGLFGFINVLAITAGISHVYRYLAGSEIQLFDLQIFPSLPILISYLSIGLLLFSIGYALTSMGYFLLKTQRDQYKLVITITISCFIIGLLMIQLYLPPSLTLNWVFLLSIVYFCGILGLSLIQLKFNRLLASFSLLRSLALYSFFVALLALPILKNAQFAKIDAQLMQNAEQFRNEEDPTARKITEQVLSILENEFRGIASEDLIHRVPNLQSKFTQTIERVITPEWRTYSLNMQLIRPSGRLVADYSTDLNAPNWTNVFDLVYLSAAIEIERITKSTNRPIVQLPDLENSEDYDTFYRGWIPIFGTDGDDQIAWILCSVYREHPDFNKPIRAVLASLTYTDWEDSYLMMEYRNGELARSNKKGVVGRYPKFNVLREAEKNALRRDSILYYTNTLDDRTYRNLLLSTSDERVIKVSTIYPDVKNLLFSFFRFSFTLLLAGLFVIPLVFAITHKRLLFWGSSKRFEHRILDSFLLATLVFLGLLIVTTHYAIKQQNEEIVRQELFEKLEGLANSTQNNPRFRRSLQSDSTFTLEALTSPLNVDAAYYDRTYLAESTTPQIYQQHLLPISLPFEVFNDLYLRQKRESLSNVSLDSQNLLIGYRSLLSPGDEPVATIAIPTFIQSPKYDRQLLETTSYLIIFYLFTFGIFVLATTFISKQLTRPLRSIQKGLNKISQGELDTEIPVNSDDEIGSLAKAYNQMVHRLREVRKELALVEREAAWKEMAQQVAHEIKNPLTPMKLNVQHLERQLSENSQSINELKSKIKKITRNLIEQIQTLNNIASDFSRFSKPINEEFTKTDINRILRSVVDLYKHDDRIDIQTDLTEYPVFVKGVDDELRRVFINLVKNAFEAIPEEGGTIGLKSFTKDGSAFIEVEDDGCGIAEDDKSRIFVPNFSTKSSGTGLGLAICKKIVEAHGGTITFASIEGKGTTFVIKMPIYET